MLFTTGINSTIGKDEKNNSTKKGQSAMLRTTSINPDFVALVKKLDAYLALCDGDEHAFYNQFNHIENLQHVVLVHHLGEAVGCGAFKPYDKETVEIKRMYVDEAGRRLGYASKILAELEKWAHELGYQNVILETGAKQTEAIAFYPKQGYALIENYGQYQGMTNSRCFKKNLTQRK
jgi:GNAT superfamily N-acetyltransferase